MGLELGGVLDDDGIVTAIARLAAICARAVRVLQKDRLAELLYQQTDTLTRMRDSKIG